MKQVLTVNAGFAQLLEFITPSSTTPSSTLFPVWPGDVSNLRAYEDWAMNEFVDRQIESWIYRVNADTAAQLAAGLYTYIMISCPELIWFFTGNVPIADIPQEAYQRFPIQDVYSSWASFCRWPKMLEGLEEAFNSSGTFSDRLPQTYALGSGLYMEGSFVLELYPSSQSGHVLLNSTTDLVSNILAWNKFPICYTSRGKTAMHPWVAMLCETLELVRQHAVRWVPADGVRKAAVKAVMRAFVYDRTEFFWKPRELYRFSQRGVQNSWFGQLAERVRSKPIPRGWTDRSYILWDSIGVGMVGYRNSRFYCGVPAARTDEWADALAKHVMTHHFPERSPTASDDVWVAQADKVILDDMREIAEEENGATRQGD